MWQPNKLEQERLDKLRELEAQGVEAYPARVERTHTTAQAIAAFTAWEDANPDAPRTGEDPAHGVNVTVCGRIRRINVKGKVSF